MKSTETLRLFLAIAIPETICAELRRLQTELLPLLLPRAVRWTKPEQFHLTLKFLGNVPATEITALGEAVRALSATVPPFPLRAEGTGFFPNHFSPRVFWVDIRSMDERLPGFHQELESAVQRFSEKPEEKKFTAHVTLARFEKLPRASVEIFVARAQTDKIFGEWTAQEVELIESRLSPAGASYATLERFGTKKV